MSYATFGPPLLSPANLPLMRSSSRRAPSRVGEDLVGRFLADHVHRAGDEEARNAREHGSVHDTQPACAVDGEFGRRHAIAVPRSNCAGAGGVVTPGVVADI